MVNVKEIYFEKIVKFIISFRVPITLFIIFLSGVSIFFVIDKLRVDSSLKVWFLEDDATYKEYLQYQQKQGSDEIISMMIPLNATIYNKSLLNRLQLLHQSLDSLNYIENSYSYYNAKYPVIRGNEIVLRDLLPKSKDPVKSLERLNRFPELKSILFSKDQKDFLVYIQLKDFEYIEGKRQMIIDKIDKIASDIFDKHYMTGIPVINAASNREVSTETVVFSSISAVLVLLLLLFVMRSKVYVPIAFVSIVLSIILLLGFYAFTGYKLNSITMLLPSLLIVYVLADMIHIFNHYHNERINHPENSLSENIIKGMKNSLKPCFYTTLTTILGYLALYSSQLFALKMLGVFAALGLLIAFVLAYPIAIIGIFYLDKYIRINVNKEENHFIEKVSERVIKFSDKKPRLILVSTIFIFVIGIFLLPEIKFNTNVLSFMTKGKAKNDYLHIADKTGGMLRIDIQLYATDTVSLVDENTLKRIENFKNVLKNTRLYDNIISILSFKKSLEKDYLFSLAFNKKFDSKSIKINEIKKSFFYLGNSDGTKLNLVANTNITGTTEIKESMRKVDSIFTSHFSDTHIRYRIQGYSPLYIKLNEYVTTSQINSFGMAFLMTFLFLVFWIKDFKMSLITLLPNLLPLLALVIIVSVFNIQVDASSVMVAPIMLGIAMDDTIHLLYHYKKNIKKGFTSQDSINKALRFTGKAIISTSISLALGFAIITLSGVSSLRVFGLLSALSVVFAFVGDILVLPALIKLFNRSAIAKKV
jgi:predicted RND superfamily exporter protein